MDARHPLDRRVLALNAGSSSIKFALFVADDPPRRLLAGKLDRIGLSGSTWSSTTQDGRTERLTIAATTWAEAVRALMDRLARLVGDGSVDGIGHRIVHGGPRYAAPERITEAVLAELRRLVPLDPEHLPGEIAVIEAFSCVHPAIPQIACFDTAFHAKLPRVAQILPVPRRLEKLGVRRYGFHGLSYAYLLEELERTAGRAAARGRVILAHLGNGASMAAVHNGQSMDTTMALTPTAGLPMSTRAGDLDPALGSFLSRTEGTTPEQFFDLVNRQSGLLGISETSSDVRDLLATEAKDHRAAEAIDVFCYQAAKWIGAYTAALGGLDTLVFSGGIGENAAEIRARVCARLPCLGIHLDPARNDNHAAIISTDTSPVTVRVIRTDEEVMIAKHVVHALTSLNKPV